MNTETKDEVPPAPDWRTAFLAVCESLPEKVEIPYRLTPEGERLANFRRICPPEFRGKIQPDRLPNNPAFDKVAKWNGEFPGPIASGKTNTAKTRAAWSSLGNLYVKENKTFAWFPVRKLISELESYESKNLTEEFFRNFSHFKILLVDDADKINADFESQSSALFAFYDWVYRNRRPCITTTNKGRDWWTEKMGEAFVRRLFDDAHFSVEF